MNTIVSALPQKWFEAEGNYAVMREEAESEFLSVMRWLRTAPDEVVHIRGHEARRRCRFVDDGSSEASLGLKPFPPEDSSWLCGGAIDEVADLAQMPKTWTRICDWGEVAMQHQVKSREHPHPHMGRVYQGRLTNFYLIQALQAVGTKPELVDELFVRDHSGKHLSAPLNGIFTLRLYKHSQWAAVVIDDFMPQNNMEQPVCCSGEDFPVNAWASLVEKAYAKLHGSWESVGGGGSIESALCDLTGGVASRFRTKEVAPDRLFAYIHLSLPFCIFACNVCTQEVAKRNVPLRDTYACSVAHTKEVGPDVLDRLVCLLVGHSNVRELISMSDNRALVGDDARYSPQFGYVWLNCLDFHQFFGEIFECRLVNSLLPQPPAGPGWTPPWKIDASKLWLQKSPRLHEHLWACPTTVESKNEPVFRIEVSKFPCEVMIHIGQSDNRMRAGEDRAEQVPVFLRVWEQVAECGKTKASDVALIGTSYWGHVRDTMMCVKVHADNEMEYEAGQMPPVVLFATVNIPGQGKFTSCKRLLARIYSRVDMQVKLLEHHDVNLVHVSPDRVMATTLYTLCGIASHPEPDMFDEKEGAGQPFGRTVGPQRAEVMTEERAMNSVEMIGQVGGAKARATVDMCDSGGYGSQWKRSFQNFIGVT
eukprot:GEMP01013570.1.p1 GENE.GEMP01013570.1~~GEMP01013570.1.p1  ORF type:complete len:648 (+),score=155.18 GEMP01013570.1:316-2259(+)